MDIQAVEAPWRNSCRHHFIANATRELFQHPLNLFCLTLYNEPLEHVAVSLAALWRSVCHARQQNSSVVVILIDGIEKADPAIMDVLSRMQRIGSSSDHDVDADCFYSCASGSLLLQAMGAAVAGIADADIRLVVCVKPANRGKLHSHAVFFASLCPRLEPEYCHQIDAGTMLQLDTVQRLVAAMEAAPDVGAVAPRNLMQPPQDGGVLTIWQYWDFIVAHAFLRPSEMASGHLSVLPGQYCVVRWRAMRTQLSGPVLEGEPVAAYLRGLAVSEPLDRIMYLAEDRVLGNEIALTHRGAWRFKYDIDAVTTTEPCETLAELLQQRRRWINSALAARLRLLAGSAKLAMTGECQLQELFKIALRSVWQINIGILEQATPAFTVCVILVTLRNGASMPAPMITASTGLIVAVLLLALVPLRRLGERTRGVITGMRDGAAAVLFLLLTVAVPISSNNLASLLLTMMMAITLVPFVGMKNLKHMRSFAIYMLIAPIVSSSLLLYSICNMHNASWGTKGLKTTQLTMVMQEKLQRLRWRVIAASVALNAAVVSVGMKISTSAGTGEIVGEANLGTSITMVEACIIMTVAATFYHLRPRQGRAPLLGKGHYELGWPEITARALFRHWKNKNSNCWHARIRHVGSAMMSCCSSARWRSQRSPLARDRAQLDMQSKRPEVVDIHAASCPVLANGARHRSGAIAEIWSERRKATS